MIGFCLCKSLPYVKHPIIRASNFNELYYFQNCISILFHRYICSIPSKNESFAVSYLKNSLGFSQETAIKLTSSSTGLHFENPEKPDLVLKFFEKHGFSKTQVSSVIKSWPKVLLSNPEKTLFPKFEYLYSKGITVPDLAKLVHSNPRILTCSLRSSIIPTYNFLKKILGFDEKVLLVFKRGMWIFWVREFKSYAEGNIGILREYGVPESNVKSLVIWRPRVLMKSCDQFRETVEEVKTLGINPLKTQFVVAVCVKRGMSKSTWEKKLDVFRECGWSDKEILLAFAKHPYCMAHSQDKIMTVMDFFVNKMGWKSSSISRFPALLSYSLEKRIIPRCSLLEVLLSKGLINKNVSLIQVLAPTEKKFLQRYVTCHEEEAPQLLKIYQEKLDIAM